MGLGNPWHRVDPQASQGEGWEAQETPGLTWWSLAPPALSTELPA